jgi:glutathione S-transferase
VVKLYEHPASGNCMKARILLRHLEIPYESVVLDLFAGEATEAEHLARNPSGEVPTLELENGEFIAQSGAILLYLAEGTPYLPGDPVDRAHVHQWLFFEQNGIEPGIATSRFWKWNGLDLERPEAYADRIARGEAELDVLEAHLAGHDFLAAGRYTVADIANYAYTHVAHETGIDMAGRPAIAAWIARVESQPGFVNDLAPFP